MSDKKINDEPAQAGVEKQSIGDVEVDVHMLQTIDGAQVAVTRIPSCSSEDTGLPVILLHGTYSKRNFWISPKGIGLGRYLSEQGFDVWIPELRGHGLSPKPDNFSAITTEEQIRFDIPAVQACVHGICRQKAVWICHSFGGVYLLAALSCNWLDQSKIGGVLTFGSQVTMGEGFLKIPPLAWLCKWLLRRIGYLPAPKLGLGPEIESAEAMIEVIGWKQLGGKWRNREGLSYWEGLKQIDIPVRCFAAVADKNDPPDGCQMMFDALGGSDKTFTLLGTAYGFQKDYDHIGMIVSKEARAEIWPLIVETIRAIAKRS